MLGERIIDAIRADGRSQRAIARASGLRPEDVSRIVRGKQGLSIGSADRLCTALGLSLEYHGTPRTEPGPQEPHHEASEPRKVRSTVEPPKPRHEPTGAVPGHWTVSARQPDGSVKLLGSVDAADLPTAKRLAQRRWPNVRPAALTLSP